jgi:hypothetical protein
MKQTSFRRNITKKDGDKAQRLLDYWVSIIKKGELTIKDFLEFVKKVAESLSLIEKYYPHKNDKFLIDLSMIWWIYEEELTNKDVSRWKKLPDDRFVLMKDYSKKFIRRIIKYFEPALIRNMKDRTPLEDSEYIIKQSNKITYRWASGIISSNYISILLTKLIKKATIKDIKTDDIKTLYVTLKNNTKNDKLKQFLAKSYRRFEDSDKTRNRCAHVNEGEPTLNEIKQNISLARLLQRYL